MNQDSNYNQVNSRLRSFLRSGYMKYIFIAALVVFVILMFRFYGGSSKPFSEVEQAVESQVDRVALSKEDDQTFKKEYALNAADYQGVMLLASPAHLDAEEVLLVKVKNDEQMQEVEEAIEQHIATRRKDFEGYMPEQVLLLDEALVTVRGNYIFMAISENAEEYQKAFLNGL